MLTSFLESADAVHVMELMREAELGHLQLTEEIELDDASRWCVLLLASPPRLVFRRIMKAQSSELDIEGVPEMLIPRFFHRLTGEALWRTVRKHLEDRLSD